MSSTRVAAVEAAPASTPARGRAAIGSKAATSRNTVATASSGALPGGQQHREQRGLAADEGAGIGQRVAPGERALRVQQGFFAAGDQRGHPVFRRESPYFT